VPMTYNSLIGDAGTSLSGSQKQRVLLASALYRRPRRLFMDEGTSHLDIATERQVTAAVKALGLTRVIIAHRPETIASAPLDLRYCPQSRTARSQKAIQSTGPTKNHLEKFRKIWAGLIAALPPQAGYCCRRMSH
jgi:ABC-type transport system involved in cytochrome bd biosynthesis fused ATPase/permease subunit